MLFHHVIDQQLVIFFGYGGKTLNVNKQYTNIHGDLFLVQLLGGLFNQFSHRKVYELQKMRLDLFKHFQLPECLLQLFGMAFHILRGQ
jgi:hypothetical protein